MSETNDRPPATGGRGAHRWLTVLVPAVTFLVGLGLGLAIMAATGGDVSPEAGTPTEEPSATATAGEGTPDTLVTVAGACEEAARNLGEATRLLDDVAASVRDFEPDQLVDLLEQLEELDGETRELARECNAAVESTDVPSESPSPTS